MLDKASGKVLHVGVVKPDERDWNPVVDVILEVIESLGEVPSAIRVRNSDMYSVLKPLQVLLGVRVRRVDSLPLMDEVIDSLAAPRLPEAADNLKRDVTGLWMR